jgi:hypothetical protein
MVSQALSLRISFLSTIPALHGKRFDIPAAFQYHSAKVEVGLAA